MPNSESGPSAWVYVGWDVYITSEQAADATRTAREWALRNGYAPLDVYVEKVDSHDAFREMLTAIDGRVRQVDGRAPAIIFPVRCGIGGRRRIARLIGRNTVPSWAYTLRVQRLY